MSKKENKGKGFFGGVIATEELTYIVGVKRINIENIKDNTYIVIINPINEVFIKEINEITGRNIGIFKKDENIKNDKNIKK